jgi:hypothetical protein
MKPINGPVCDIDGIQFATLVNSETGEKLYLRGLRWRDKYPAARLSEDEDEERER